MRATPPPRLPRHKRSRMWALLRPPRVQASPEPSLYRLSLTSSELAFVKADGSPGSPLACKLAVTVAGLLPPDLDLVKPSFVFRFTSRAFAELPAELLQSSCRPLAEFSQSPHRALRHVKRRPFCKRRRAGAKLGGWQEHARPVGGSLGSSRFPFVARALGGQSC